MTQTHAATLAGAAPDDVRNLCQRLRSAGHRAWVVGGCVRDLLLREMHEPTSPRSIRNDWDIATDARPEQVERLFRRVIPTGIQHGTVTVMVGKTGYEVTTLRGETTYSDGRRPDEVYFVDDITADLARRDFTVNAIALDLLDEQLIDPFDGIGDLRARKLRAVGDPLERFREDGLRVLRAARFVATLELQLDERTASAIEPSLDSYRKVSAERIRDEWMKTLGADRASPAFEIMREHGMLAITAPEMLILPGTVREGGIDEWELTMRRTDACAPTPVLRMSSLLANIGFDAPDANDGDIAAEHRARSAERIAERLRCSGAERTRISRLVRYVHTEYDSRWSDADVRRWLRDVGPDLLDDLGALMAADAQARGAGAERTGELGARARAALEAGVPLATGSLALKGGDLIRELGIKPGPEVGELIRALLERVLDDPSLNEPTALLELARQLLADN